MNVFPNSKIPLFERLLIESQSNCNRSCWFCPRTYDRSGKYLDRSGQPTFNQMPTWKVLDLLDQAHALGFRGPVGFHHYSEPLLDRRHLMLAKEATSRGMVPTLHTNGDVLKDNDALCDKVKGAYQSIVLGLYDYQTNEELEQIKQFWRQKLRGVKLEFSPIGLVSGRRAYSIGIPRALVPSNNRMAAPDLKFVNAPCHRPIIRLIIRHDGEMCHCCEDTQGEFELGSVYQNSLKDLWFSARHVHTIEQLLLGRRQKFVLCRNCPLPASAPAPDGAKIGIALRRYVVSEPTVNESER